MTGTGIAIRGNDLYADVQSAIVRYHLIAGQLQPSATPDTIVRGIPTGGHNARNIAIDAGVADIAHGGEARLQILARQLRAQEHTFAGRLDDRQQ